MEFRKHMLRVLSIGLMLSVFSPVQAEPKWKLYKKCIMRKCSDTEKAQVRADVKKAGIRSGALLIAAAIAIGAAMLLKQFSTSQKEDALIEAALGWAGNPRVVTGQKNYLKIFTSWSIKNGDKSDAQLKAELKKKGANPQGDACIEVAAAYIYYYNTNQGPPGGEQVREFRNKRFPESAGGSSVLGGCQVKEAPKPSDKKQPVTPSLLQSKRNNAERLLQDVKTFLTKQYQQEQRDVDKQMAKLSDKQSFSERKNLILRQLNELKSATEEAKKSLENALQATQPGQEAKLDSAIVQAEKRGRLLGEYVTAYYAFKDAIREKKEEEAEVAEPLRQFEFTPAQKAKIAHLKTKSGNSFVWYEVLNVAPQATDAQIKSAYKPLMLKYHPDKNPQSEKEIYEEIFKAVGNAKDIAPEEKKKEAGQGGPAPKRQRLTY